jgi:DNA-binding transcriptional regulator YiaG
MTTTNSAEEQILKTDTKGRIRTSTERRATLLEEFDRSGLTGPKFAELVGIKYQTFATWLQKRRKGAPARAQSADTVKWLEAVVEKAQMSGGKSPSSLVVELPSRARMEISNANQVILAADLLRALARSC